MADGSAKEEEDARKGCTGPNVLILTLLTVAFVVGEIGHFLISVLTLEVSRDIGYGEKKCYQAEAVDETSVVCKEIETEEEYVMSFNSSSYFHAEAFSH